MLATDFRYDGQYLSDYHLIIVEFDAPSNFTEAQVGANITFNKVSRAGGKKFSISSTTYDEALTTKFDICKDDTYFNRGEMTFTDDEFRDIARWLIQPEYHEFCFIQDDDFGDIRYFNASFNIEKIMLNSQIVGIRVSMETDRPYAFGEKEEQTLTFAAANASASMTCFSDLVGYVPIKMVVTCNESANFQIKNSTTNKTMLLKNCVSTEVITIDGENQLISTDKSATHDICDDFNYEFLTLQNSLTSRTNTFTADHKCTLKITYRPIVLSFY